MPTVLGDGVPDDVLVISGTRNCLYKDKVIKVVNTTKNETYETEHTLSERQIEMVLAGSLINLISQEG